MPEELNIQIPKEYIYLVEIRNKIAGKDYLKPQDIYYWTKVSKVDLSCWESELILEIDRTYRE